MGLEKDHCVICVCPCHCALREQIFPKILSTFSDFYGLLVFIMIVATCNGSCNIQQCPLCFLYQSFYCCRKFQICFHDRCASGALCAFGQHQSDIYIVNYTITYIFEAKVYMYFLCRMSLCGSCAICGPCGSCGYLCFMCHLCLLCLL